MEVPGNDFDLRIESFFRGLDAIKERHDALALKLERSRREIQDLNAKSKRDGENLLALVRHAEA